MNGSVFYTWRQHDSARDCEQQAYSKCWPQDWLSKQYPSARILGLNATLKPFLWNQICPVDRIK
ncbi:Serine active site containing protein 1 [Cichlidogyrus casuarinus]|uniref:Serine active site containing protein 1 n=1 Tax=Cichlidogyrus casuarinus TaxID=1844966 RepID=A0ABD2Q7P6_9PLAT